MLLSMLLHQQELYFLKNGFAAHQSRCFFGDVGRAKRFLRQNPSAIPKQSMKIAKNLSSFQ